MSDPKPWPDGHRPWPTTMIHGRSHEEVHTYLWHSKRLPATPSGNARYDLTCSSGTYRTSANSMVNGTIDYLCSRAARSQMHRLAVVVCLNKRGQAFDVIEWAP